MFKVRWLGLSHSSARCMRVQVGMVPRRRFFVCYGHAARAGSWLRVALFRSPAAHVLSQIKPMGAV